MQSISNSSNGIGSGWFTFKKLAALYVGGNHHGT